MQKLSDIYLGELEHICTQHHRCSNPHIMLRVLIWVVKTENCKLHIRNNLLSGNRLTYPCQSLSIMSRLWLQDNPCLATHAAEIMFKLMAGIFFFFFFTVLISSKSCQQFQMSSVIGAHLFYWIRESIPIICQVPSPLLSTATIKKKKTLNQALKQHGA